MAVKGYPSERDFLIGLAVKIFNRQYKDDIDPKACTIQSIRPNYGCTHGYEIFTVDEGDFLRLRVYFSLTDRDRHLEYRVELDPTVLNEQGTLGDEVYCCIGTLSHAWVDDGIYTFRWINAQGSTTKNYFEDMEGVFLEWMGGGYIETFQGA